MAIDDCLDRPTDSESAMPNSRHRILPFFASLTLLFSDAVAGEKFPAAKFDEVRAFVYNLNSTPEYSKSFVQEDGQLHPSNCSGEGFLLNPQQREKLIAALNAKKKNEGALCYIPHHAFVFYKAGKPVASIDICFLCGNFRSQPSKTPAIDFGAIIQIMSEIGLPLMTSLDEVDLLRASLEQAPEGNVLLNEEFEDVRSLMCQKLVRKSQITHLPNGGKDGNGGIRVAFEGNARGSARVVERFPLRRAVTNATLSFDVYFESDFQFVNGGKLHGLGPANPATGGKKPGPKDWSARIMFGPEGRAKTYNYHQLLKGSYGEGTPTDGPPLFRTNTWHQVSYYIELNDPAYVAPKSLGWGGVFPSDSKEQDPEVKAEPERTGDGIALLFIDGQLVNSLAPEILFRDEDDKHSLIQQLLFSTFHGGQSPSWAPKNKDQSFATVHARFDNFSVHEGAYIRHPYNFLKAP